MRTSRTLLAVAASLALTSAVATTAPAVAAKGSRGRGHRLLRAGRHRPIHPGVQTNTEGRASAPPTSCYTDGAGAVYVGHAAHCSGLGEATDTNGCTAGVAARSAPA